MHWNSETLKTTRYRCEYFWWQKCYTSRYNITEWTHWGSQIYSTTLCVTLFYITTLNGDIAIIKHLEEHDADVIICTDETSAPLYSIVEKNHWQRRAFSVTFDNFKHHSCFAGHELRRDLADSWSISDWKQKWNVAWLKEIQDRRSAEKKTKEVLQDSLHERGK
jgi:hypothetical protein